MGEDLEQVIIKCPYTIEQWYADNGKEYKGEPIQQAFMTACTLAKIEPRFIRVKTPQTNGKAERVNGTINNARGS